MISASISLCSKRGVVVRGSGLPLRGTEPDMLVGQDLAGPPAEKHGSQVRPIVEFSGVRALPGMGVHQMVENISQYEL